jgi:GMP synthase (glutamine-hydrolysing)
MERQILLLDIGSWLGKCIREQLIELGVAPDMRPMTADIDLSKYAGVIVSGSPDDPRAGGELGLVSNKIPVLGISYGMHLIVDQSGGRPGKRAEWGRHTARFNPSRLFAGLKSEEMVFLNSDSSVEEMGKGFTAIAIDTDDGKILGIEKGNIFGLQFHPEFTSTPCGKIIFSNFLFDICGLPCASKDLVRLV